MKMQELDCYHHAINKKFDTSSHKSIHIPEYAKQHSVGNSITTLETI
jgi:hypothetical protein